MTTQKKKSDNQRTADGRALCAKYSLVPDDGWQWYATLTNEVSPPFITLYAFKMGCQPEVYFIWLTDYDEIVYWLFHLFNIPATKQTILEIIYSPKFPDSLYAVAVDKLLYAKDFKLKRMDA